MISREVHQVISSYSLDAAQLATLYGGTLPDGSYGLTLRATDTSNRVSTEATHSFSLDRTTPLLNLFGLQDGATWRSLDLPLQGKVTTSRGDRTTVFYSVKDGLPLVADGPLAAGQMLGVVALLILALAIV